MNFVKWHQELSIKIRLAILCFIGWTILDNSTLFDISISETLDTSTNLSTWLSASILGIGFIDSFSFHLVSLHLLLLFVLLGALRAPFRNIWALECTLVGNILILAFSTYQLLEPMQQTAVLLNTFFQSLKLIPLGLAYYWTRQLAVPSFIT